MVAQLLISLESNYFNINILWIVRLRYLPVSTLLTTRRAGTTLNKEPFSIAIYTTKKTTEVPKWFNEFNLPR
jgi:hypothetical protein